MIQGNVPEPLEKAIALYLQENPDWSADRVLTVALGMFVLQNYSSVTPEGAAATRCATRIYLDHLFTKVEL